MSSLKWIVLNDEYNGQDSNIEEVSVSDIRIEVEDNATNLLYTKNEPVNLISIFGQARMGKSTFMNILAGVDNYDNEIFKTSSDSETVTTGVDISKIFVPLQEFSKFNDNPEIDSSTLIGFVDTEGQGNKGEEFDIYLFSPILAISKIVIFWWPALLQVDSILNSLGAMTNSAKRITKEAQCQHQNTKPYGHLHIVFRSWNNKETPERVKNLLLESKESSSKKGKEHNNIRELLNDSFESIDIWLFPTNGPKKNENLLFEDFNDNWKQTFKDMHKKFSDQLSVNEPKHGAEKPWTGRDIAEFTKLLCKTLTSSENYAINSIFERMQIVRAKTLAKNAIDEFRVIVNEMDPQYKVDGCDSVGIDACLYEKLKSFEETLKWESFSHNVVKEIYEDYNKTISLIADEIKTKIAALTIKVQNLQNQFDESVSTIVLPLSKSDLTMALNEKVMQLWGYFDDMIKDFPKGLIKQHRENLNTFCKEKSQQITAENEKTYAINDFRKLVNEMNPLYKVEGCNFEGIDAYLYEELKIFKEKLKTESLSDNIANEIYADYKKTTCFIVSEIKIKIGTLTIEAQNLQNRFDKSASIIMLPLSKSDLTKVLNELTRRLWCDFDDMAKEFPKGFVQQHRKRLENSCEEKNQYIAADNEKINALNDFCTLVNEMNPRHKEEGCDSEGIDAYLYEELKIFKAKLKSEGFSDKIVNEIYSDYKKSVKLIVREIKIKITALTVEVQNFQNRFVESVSNIVLPLSKSDLTKSLNEKITQLWNDFDDMVKDFPKGFVQQHRKMLEIFCKQKNHYIAAENEKINALNDFRELINEMNPQHKAEGCDSEGIDAYLYEELKNFKEKLKSEGLSDNIVNEIYADYDKTICLIASETKNKTIMLTVELQSFQDRLDRYEKTISIVEEPLKKSDLTASLNELIQESWIDFDNMVRDFPRGFTDFVQKHREKFEKFCKEKKQHITAENEKKIILYAQKNTKQSLRKLVKKLKKRLPMTQEKLCFEWTKLLTQIEELYLNLYEFFDATFPDDLHIITNPFWELLREDNSKAWKNKAEVFRERAKVLFKGAFATNFPINDKKIFNNTEIEHYFQEEILRFSYNVSNIFPYTMMDDICNKYKENIRSIAMNFQEKNNKNIKKISQKIEQHIIEWDILLDANIRRYLERWQHEVTELLLNSNAIPELATLPSFQLLYICNDITDLNRETIPSSFRNIIKSIIGRDMGDILFEQFVITILEGLESNELKSAQMSFINRCLGITALTFPIRQLFYKRLFVHKPFMFAGPIIWRVFLAEYEKYQNERHRNAFFDLISNSQMVFDVLPDLKVINDLLKGNDQDSPIAALSCDIIQKTFFAHYELTELHHNFSEAINSISTNNIEPLQNISALAFLKEYVRAFYDANKEHLRTFRNVSMMEMPVDTNMAEIIRDINNQLESECPKLHLLKVYFLKYLRFCNFSMQDIKDLCESQMQTFPWLNEIPWENNENWLSFNPYWLHQNYKIVEEYYSNIYDCSKYDDNNMCFTAFLERRNRVNRMLQLLGILNQPLTKNDLVIFAGVIAARLHYIRASRELTVYEKRIIKYLIEETTTMNASPAYKEIFRKLLLNTNPLIQLLNENEVNRVNNEVNEFFMKSVIVHLLIVHASIPNNASPLAAYLHQLQVCQNDFILTCPSDVGGVVMNAMASGTGGGVTRYQCVCGEIFFVEDCGNFGKPEERPSESVSGRCLFCKRLIGYGSNQNDYKRLDSGKVTSVPINHKSGYIVEQIATEKTHNVRMMTPQAYRILHLFVHTILCSSAPSSVTSQFFAKNGNNAGDTIAHCLNNIRNDWKILKVIYYDCNDEQLALILHSIISSMFKELSSQEWRLNTPEKRENWEDKFSKTHYVSNVIVTVQDIRNEMSRDRISLTEEEIDDMLSAKDPEYYILNLPRLWRKIKDVSFRSLHAYYLIDENNKVNYPFLEVFFRHEKELNLIKNLLPILKFVKVLKIHLEYQITRQEAREMTFDKFIKQESSNGEFQEISSALNSAFRNFEESWNTVAPFVKQYRCQQFENFPLISLESSVMFGLADENDGIYLCAILSYLIELQNQFLGKTIAIPFGSCLALKFLETRAEFHETDEENAPSSSSTAQNARASYYLQTVQIQNAQPANFIDYDWNDEILQLSQRNLEIRYGEDIVYNLLHIEMELANQLVFNKVLINSNFNTSFPFYKEMFFRKFYILTDISDFVAQEPLPTANINVYGHVLDESFSSENASIMLPALEMLICSINCQIDGETSIKDYISQQMDLTILTENADFCGMFSTDLRLKHLISLYERVERAMTYTFDNIDVKYKEPLSQRMERRIINVIDFENRFQNRISACELLTALKRFLVRYLMVESLTSIPTSDELTNYIIDENFGCWPSNNSLEIAKNLFPSAIRVDQTFSVYELINFGQISSHSSE